MEAGGARNSEVARTAALTICRTAPARPEASITAAVFAVEERSNKPEKGRQIASPSLLLSRFEGGAFKTKKGRGLRQSRALRRQLLPSAVLRARPMAAHLVR